MTGGRTVGHPRKLAYPCRNPHELPIHGQEDAAMLTTTIIFAVLVALWGRLGTARPG
jgi:hypothetical protein